MVKATLNNVIGPFVPEDWLTLKMLKSSIDYMKNTDSSKYSLNIKQEKEVFNYILTTYQEKAA